MCQFSANTDIQYDLRQMMQDKSYRLHIGMLSYYQVRLEVNDMSQLSHKGRPIMVPAAPFLHSRWLNFHDSIPDTQQEMLLSTVKRIDVSKYSESPDCCPEESLLLDQDLQLPWQQPLFGTRTVIPEDILVNFINSPTSGSSDLFNVRLSL